jgi:hypothetical protein
MAIREDSIASEAGTTQQEIIPEDDNSDSISGGQNEILVMLRDFGQMLDENNATIKRIEKSIPSLYNRLDKIYSDMSSTVPRKKDKKGNKKKGKDSKSSSKNAAANSEKKKGKKMSTKSKNKSGGKKNKGKKK